MPPTYRPHPNLICGPYPHDPAPLLAAGVTLSLDLTEPGELHQYSVFSEQCSVRHSRFPIPDFGTPTREQMAAILDALDAALEAGHTVYLHCHGGKGRTGTVLGCWLVRRGLSAEQALEKIAALRAAAGLSGHSPETEEQRAFVRGWQDGQVGK